MGFYDEEIRKIVDKPQSLYFDVDLNRENGFDINRLKEEK
jgi:hypothetical protein